MPDRSIRLESAKWAILTSLNDTTSRLARPLEVLMIFANRPDLYKHYEPNLQHWINPEMITGPIAQNPSVKADGSRIIDLIDGVLVRPLITHEDARGTLCELYSDSWGFDDIPMVHTYTVTARPGQIKGWALHQRQIDRYAFLSGSTKLVLFDSREGSESHGVINELFFSESNRALVLVPPGIWHAVQALGTIDSLLFNFPSDPYDYEQPDKLLLPIENDIIPYRFD